MPILWMDINKKMRLLTHKVNNIYFIYVPYIPFTLLGPLPKTTPDFWRMIWEQHCLVIVMTTRAMERGRPKCHQYWELEVGTEATYGQFIVRTVSVETDQDYTVTSINLTNKKVIYFLSSHVTEKFA